MTSDSQSPAPPPSRARTLRPLAAASRHPIRCGVVLGGLGLVAVAGGPLAAQAWAVFWSLPHAGRLVLCVIGLAGIALAALWGVRLQLRERAEQARLGSVVAVAWMVVIAVVVLIVAGTWWVMGAPRPLVPDQLPPRALDAIATRAFAVVAGLGAAALLVISYRRQRTTEAENARAELAVAREDTKLFNGRFTAAYNALGSDHAAVRLGAVHALAHAGDDAPEGREELVQMVIDVLCAYLRMPYRPAPEPLPEDADAQQRDAHRQRELEFASMREVRHTIIRVIGNHLRQDTRWRGKDYDFTVVVFDGGDLHGAVFSGGQVSFDRAVFSGGNVSFDGAEFSGGQVSFHRAKFSGGGVFFNGAVFSDGQVSFFAAKFSGGQVSFDRAVFSGGNVSFDGAVFFRGRVDLNSASGTCPTGLLEAIERGEPGVVLLPEPWQPAADQTGEEEDPATPPGAPTLE